MGEKRTGQGFLRVFHLSLYLWFYLKLSFLFINVLALHSKIHCVVSVTRILLEFDLLLKLAHCVILFIAEDCTHTWENAW